MTNDQSVIFAQSVSHNYAEILKRVRIKIQQINYTTLE